MDLHLLNSLSVSQAQVCVCVCTEGPAVKILRLRKSELVFSNLSMISSSIQSAISIGDSQFVYLPI